MEFYYIDRRNPLSPEEAKAFSFSTFGNGQAAIGTSENIDDNIVAAEALFNRIKHLQEKLGKITNFKKGWQRLFYQE